jgi:hypothetical protein
MIGACGRNEQEKKYVQKSGLEESVGRGTLARTRRRLNDNIKVDAE